MNLHLTFDEINAFIKQEVKAVDIILSQVNDKTLRANITKLFIKQDINLSIDKIDGNYIYLTLAGSTAIDSIIKGAVALMQEFLPKWIEQISDTSFVLKMDKIEKAQKVLQYLSLQEVSVLPQGIDVQVLVKP